MLGTLLGPACDWFHVFTHTAGYAYPALFGLAWWVPLLFGLATVAVALSHIEMDRLCKREPRKIAWSTVWAGLFSFVAIYFISGFMRAPFAQKFIILGIIAVMIWFVFDRTVYGFLLGIATALAGCMVEITLCRSRMYYYTSPDFLGIPAWLPFLYLAASVSVGNLSRKLLGEENSVHEKLFM